MQAKIRSAGMADLGALIDLENRSFSSDRISRASMRQLIASQSAAVLIAEVDARLAGYAVVLSRRGSRSTRLYSIAVEPQHPGLGRQLLAAAEIEAARRGAAAIRLEVRADNIRAINLYKRADYSPIGQKPGYYADGATAIRYEKSLTLPSDVARLIGTAAA